MRTKTYRDRVAAGRCPYCGGIPVPGQLSCADCADKRRRERRAAREKQKRLKQKNMALQETIKAAEAEGLSYGQYVAKHSAEMEWRIGKNDSNKE